MQRRQFTEEFKLRVLSEVASGKSIAEVTRSFNLSKNSVREWQDQAARATEMVMVNQQQLTAMKTTIADLERLVGRLAAENDILKKVAKVQSQMRGEIE
jgi:transposase-like protein